jgi:hypothetical protein
MAQEYIEDQLDRIEAQGAAILAKLNAGGGTPPVEPGPVDPEPVDPDDEDNDPPEPPDHEEPGEGEPDEQEPTDPSPPPTPNPNRHPSQVLPVLRWWTIMLPTGGQGDPDSLYLVDKSIKDTYYVDSNGAVVFECPADGVHSPNSKYARTEGAQMVPGKQWKREPWRSGPDESDPATAGVRHELYAELAIDMSGLTGQRPRINGLQIHDGGDDVMQVQFREDGSLGISHKDGKAWEVLDSAYPNAAFFTCRITVQAHMITVQYARGGKAKVVTIPKRGSGWYWKAGCYINTGGASEFTQPAGARGRVLLRKLEVTPA